MLSFTTPWHFLTDLVSSWVRGSVFISFLSVLLVSTSFADSYRLDNRTNNNSYDYSNSNNATSTNSGKNASNSWYSNNTSDGQEDLDSAFNERFFKTVPINQLPMLHPKGPSLWRLRQLFLEVGVSDFSQFDTCGREISILADKASNPQAILLYSDKLKKEILVRPATYHWCFYYWSLDLENRIGSDLLARSYIAQQDFFIHRTRGLLILARALADQKEGWRYFSFLRTRYMEISKVYFARELEIFSGIFSQNAP